jgi:peptidoglycan hydrolase CwlO-like protein
VRDEFEEEIKTLKESLEETSTQFKDKSQEIAMTKLSFTTTNFKMGQLQKEIETLKT